MKDSSAAETEIRIHRILIGSRANGPGLRNVIWLQGCTLACPGCFNPRTHDKFKGKVIPVIEVCEALLSGPCDGITISGGEPFQQPGALKELLKELNKRNAPAVLVFSGYTFDEIRCDDVRRDCVNYIDALICGPYKKDLPSAHEKFCSSNNQELILLSDRLKESDFSNLPLSEVIIEVDGSLVKSGIVHTSASLGTVP